MASFKDLGSEILQIPLISHGKIVNFDYEVCKIITFVDSLQKNSFISCEEKSQISSI